MDELHLPSIFENSQRVLVAGAGGGFDLYAGLPIYERLRSLRKEVFLANLSFVSLETTNAQALTRALYAIEPATTGADLYFPERALAQFLSRREENVRIYAFEKLGVAPIREGYTHLVQSLALDALCSSMGAPTSFSVAMKQVSAHRLRINGRERELM
jgi:hypothetical protein